MIKDNKKQTRRDKFRGKSLEQGNWLFGSLWVNGEKAYIIHEIASEKEGENLWYNANATEVDPSTVGQYTGLIDMKYTKIYEGDIVSTERARGAIVYDIEGACFAVKGKQNSENIKLGIYSMIELKVIGNIHDNPGLLICE